MKPRQRRRRKARQHLFDEMGPISDETAAAIAQLLSDLHMQFEERFFGKIRRHANATRAPPKNPNQPWAPGPSESDEPL